MEPINLAAKLATFSDAWNPRIVAELNGQHVKVVRLSGEFVWHHHDAEDELFLVLAGRLRMEMREGGRERAVELEPGELIVIPRGVDHRPVAIGDVQVLLFEPAGTLNTGNVREARTRDTLERI